MTIRHKNDLTMILNDKTAVGRIIGRVLLIEQDNSYVYNQRTERIEPNKNKYDPLFLYEMLNAPGIRSKIVRQCQGNTQIYVNWPVIANQKYKIPELKEQKIIGFFLKDLDHLITLHQRKLDQLKTLKKYFLQNMFPAKGEKVPRIRFKGFTGDWEQRKFFEIAQRESNMRLSSSDFPSVEYEDVVSEAGILNKNISAKGTQKTGIIFDGSQILYGKLRPYLHNWLSPDFNGVAVGDWWVLRPIETNKDFLYRLIQTQEFDDIANQSSGSKMPRADWNLVANTMFMISTSIIEQRKIGTYFNYIDNLITLHQCKIDQFQTMKKFMLQNLFI